MKTELVTRVLIKRNFEAVFDYIADVENDIHWRSGVISMTQSTKGYTDLTSVQNEVLSLFGKTFKIKSIITKYVHNSGYSFRIFKGIPGLTGYRKVLGLGGDTLVTYSVSIDINPVFSLLLLPMKFIFKKRFEHDLNRLKSILEKAAKESKGKIYSFSKPLQALQTIIFNLFNGIVFITDNE
jgi:Polyketide cyclase / dehydrase and lipid transport